MDSVKWKDRDFISFGEVVSSNVEKDMVQRNLWLRSMLLTQSLCFQDYNTKRQLGILWESDKKTNSYVFFFNGEYIMHNTSLWKILNNTKDMTFTMLRKCKLLTWFTYKTKDTLEGILRGFHKMLIYPLKLKICFNKKRKNWKTKKN